VLVTAGLVDATAAAALGEPSAAVALGALAERAQRHDMPRVAAAARAVAAGLPPG
jgi:hypothetical protein